MKNQIMKKFIASMALMMVLAGLSVFASTLDDAPFKLSSPGDGWNLSDSKAQDLGRGVSLVAMLTKTNSTMKSVVVKAVSDGSFVMSLDQLVAGMHDSFGDPRVKNVTDVETTFLGFKAHRFTYDMTQDAQTIYNEVVVFAVGNTGWTIATMGPVAQKAEIKKIFDCYQKRDSK